MSKEIFSFDFEYDGEPEVPHTHFDCPACNRKNASTNIYDLDFHIEEVFLGEEILELRCEACGAIFTLVEKPKAKWVPPNTLKWKRMGVERTEAIE